VPRGPTAEVVTTDATGRARVVEQCQSCGGTGLEQRLRDDATPAWCQLRAPWTARDTPSSAADRHDRFFPAGRSWRPASRRSLHTLFLHGSDGVTPVRGEIVGLASR
jgi:hypothetical protein